MTDKTDEILKRATFQYGKPLKPPSMIYKKVMSHKEETTLIRGFTRHVPHIKPAKLPDPPVEHSDFLHGVYLGWKEIARQQKGRREEAQQTFKELKKQEKE